MQNLQLHLIGGCDIKDGISNPEHLDKMIPFVT